MCDELTERDNEAAFARGTNTRAISRRHFNALAATTALAMALPTGTHASDVTESDVTVTTPDGSADAYFVHPASGRPPGVLGSRDPSAVDLRAGRRRRVSGLRHSCGRCAAVGARTHGGDLDAPGRPGWRSRPARGGRPCDAGRFTVTQPRPPA